jgi:hypothetical protein
MNTLTWAYRKWFRRESMGVNNGWLIVVTSAIRYHDSRPWSRYIHGMPWTVEA